MGWLHMVPIAHPLSSVSAAVEDGVFEFVFVFLLVNNVAESRFRLSHNIYSINPYCGKCFFQHITVVSEFLYKFLKFQLSS